MLFPIQYITHDIEKVQEIPEHFFTELQKGKITTFCEDLFPKWMRKERFKGAIKNRFEELYNAIRGLSEDEQKQVYQAFFDSNQIEEICGDVNLKATSIDDLPESIRSITKKTFVWLYEYILTHKDSPITKILQTSVHDHYKEYEKNPRVCPFCGLENIRLLDSEGRTDYDHYFHKSKYPFSTVNMKGLIPIGAECNNLKGTKDVLFDEDGNRVPVFYPFSFNRAYGRDYKFVLNCKEKPSTKDKRGKWKIEFFSLIEDDSLKIQLNNWERIFSICGRYGEHIEKGNSWWLNSLISRKKISNSIKAEREVVINELQNLLLLNEPTPLNISNNTEIIPRFLYFKFLKDDEDFALELIQLLIEKSTKVEEDQLEL